MYTCKRIESNLHNNLFQFRIKPTMDDSDAAVHFSQRGAYRKCVFCNINSLDIEPGVVVHFFKYVLY